MNPKKATRFRSTTTGPCLKTKYLLATVKLEVCETLISNSAASEHLIAKEEHDFNWEPNHCRLRDSSLRSSDLPMSGVTVLINAESPPSSARTRPRKKSQSRNAYGTNYLSPRLEWASVE
ncbi:hypothetical protein ColTof3_01522 [Colletotrichum tofieldiae]|nr:hypothetical protein ColTof3_01522 [Colletotrichum tofieldiae]GKT95886.1 hypothetical protein Ct61P_13736 [Colletotrichum tofieldiae]